MRPDHSQRFVWFRWRCVFFAGLLFTTEYRWWIAFFVVVILRSYSIFFVVEKTKERIAIHLPHSQHGNFLLKRSAAILSIKKSVVWECVNKYNLILFASFSLTCSHRNLISIIFVVAIILFVNIFMTALRFCYKLFCFLLAGNSLLQIETKRKNVDLWIFLEIIFNLFERIRLFWFVNFFQFEIQCVHDRSKAAIVEQSFSFGNWKKKT